MIYKEIPYIPFGITTQSPSVGIVAPIDTQSADLDQNRTPSRGRPSLGLTEFGSVGGWQSS